MKNKQLTNEHIELKCEQNESLHGIWKCIVLNRTISIFWRNANDYELQILIASDFKQLLLSRSKSMAEAGLIGKDSK